MLWGPLARPDFPCISIYHFAVYSAIPPNTPRLPTIYPHSARALVQSRFVHVSPNLNRASPRHLPPFAHRGRIFRSRTAHPAVPFSDHPFAHKALPGALLRVSTRSLSGDQGLSRKTGCYLALLIRLAYDKV